MNYNPAYLLDMENYKTFKEDATHIVYFNVILSKNNMYGLPQVPDGFDSYFVLGFYGNEIYIATDKEEDIYKTFDVTKLTVKES